MSLHIPCTSTRQTALTSFTLLAQSVTIFFSDIGTLAFSSASECNGVNCTLDSVKFTYGYFFCFFVKQINIVGFTTISSQLDPRKVANMLDRLYREFDNLSNKYDIFKVGEYCTLSVCVRCCVIRTSRCLTLNILYSFSRNNWRR